MFKSLDDIIYDALFYIEHLHCSSCKTDVDFYIESKTPKCVHCNNKLVVTFNDFKPLRTLSGRAAIKRLSAKLG